MESCFFSSSHKKSGTFVVVVSSAMWVMGMLSFEGFLSELLACWGVSGPCVTGWMLEML
jgi:hypothetical protein